MKNLTGGNATGGAIRQGSRCDRGNRPSAALYTERKGLPPYLLLRQTLTRQGEFAVSIARRLATFVASVFALGVLAIAVSAPAHAAGPLVPRAFTLNPTTTTAWIWDSSVNGWTNLSRTNALP